MGDAMASIDRAPRQTGLDAWRTIAVALVFLRHLGDAQPHEAGIWRAIAAVGRSGWLGVDCFFVLSGFLVGGLLFGERRRRGSIAIGSFLARRGLKIYPAFYAFIAGTLLASFAAHRSWASISWSAVLSECLFVQNYGPFLWRHTWSLALEEHFYLALALLLGWLSGRRRDGDPFAAWPRIVVAIAAAVLAGRCLQAWWGVPVDLIHYASHSRVDALLFGSLLAYLYQRDPPVAVAWVRQRAVALAALGFALLAPAIATSQSALPYGAQVEETLGFTTAYLGFGCLLMVTTSADAPRSAIARALQGAVADIGRHSYSIYLWHWLVLRTVQVGLGRLLHHPPGYGASLVVGLAAAIAVGIVMAKIVEFPVLKLRERWFPSRSGAAPAVAAAPTGVAAAAVDGIALPDAPPGAA